MTNEEAIGALGFNEKESLIYLALLKMGVGSAVSLARKTGIKRPTVYFTLEELEKKGAAFLIPRSKKDYTEPKIQNSYLNKPRKDYKKP